MAPISYRQFSPELRRLFESLDRYGLGKEPDGEIDELKLAEMEGRLEKEKGIGFFVSQNRDTFERFDELPAPQRREMVRTLQSYLSQLKPSPPMELLPAGATLDQVTSKPCTTSAGLIIQPGLYPHDWSVTEGGTLQDNNGTMLVTQGTLRSDGEQPLLENGELVEEQFSLQVEKAALSRDGARPEGTVQLTTSSGSFTLVSNKSFRVIPGPDGYPVVTTSQRLLIQPAEREDNSLFVENGDVVLIDPDRFGFSPRSRFGFGEPPAGNGEDIAKSYGIFTVSKPTFFSFGEMTPGAIRPRDYQASTIEILARENNYAIEPRLKFSLREGNNVMVELQNPTFDSIYADTPGGTQLTLKQFGGSLSLETNVVERFYSEIQLPQTRDDGKITVGVYGETVDGGQNYLPFTGNRILFPVAVEFARSQEGWVLNQGRLDFFEPQGDGGSMNFWPPDETMPHNYFNLSDYHEGKPIPLNAQQNFFSDFISLAEARGDTEEIIRLVLLSRNPEYMKRCIQTTNEKGVPVLQPKDQYLLAKAYFQKTGHSFDNSTLLEDLASHLFADNGEDTEGMVNALLEMGEAEQDLFRFALQEGKPDIARRFSGDNPENLADLKSADGDPEGAITDYLRLGKVEAAALTAINDLKDPERGVRIYEDATLYEQAADLQNDQAFAIQMQTKRGVPAKELEERAAKIKEWQDKALANYRRVSPERADLYLETLRQEAIRK
ncbi:MAG: hypothetical protein HYS22_02000 [Deltaproteobacteria bacterium]|nr:hypothetical protein [Deltaproteobacteria bacterium]